MYLFNNGKRIRILRIHDLTKIYMILDFSNTQILNLNFHLNFKF